MIVRDLRLESFHECILLVTEAVDPSIFWLLIVGQHISGLITEILLAQLQRPLDLDLLHAAIFRLALDVRSWHIQPLVSVELGLGALHGTLRLPLVRDVNDRFRLGLEQAPGALEGVAANWHLHGGSKLDF